MKLQELHEMLGAGHYGDHRRFRQIDAENITPSPKVEQFLAALKDLFTTTGLLPSHAVSHKALFMRKLGERGVTSDHLEAVRTYYRDDPMRIALQHGRRLVGSK